MTHVVQRIALAALVFFAQIGFLNVAGAPLPADLHLPAAAAATATLLIALEILRRRRPSASPR